MCHRRMQRMHLRGAAAHRVGDDIGTRPHRGSQVGHTISFQGIDAYGRDALPRTAILDETFQQLPRLTTSLGRRKVLKIHDQRIGPAVDHGNMGRTACASSENPCAAKVGIRDGHLELARAVKEHSCNTGTETSYGAMSLLALS